MTLEISADGIEFIKQFEGFSAKAYPDPATGGKPFTIGYGTTRIDGNPVVMGMTCTEDEAFQWLGDDANDYLSGIESSINSDIVLTGTQVDSIASFVYNAGVGNFLKSTLLKKINAGDWAGASQEFLKWNRAAGKVMSGLTRRRAAESKLFMSELNG